MKGSSYLTIWKVRFIYNWFKLVIKMCIISLLKFEKNEILPVRSLKVHF